MDIRDRIPYIPHREFSIAYMIAELVWYLSGNDSTEWISNYSGFWRNISDDGVTANSAYGARIFKKHKYHSILEGNEELSISGRPSFDSIPGDWTQWQFVKEELSRDSDSRRAVIHIRMPQDSFAAKKDVPCTLTLQFFIRDGKLHQVANMRSSDLILGIAYDIPAFTMFQELLAFELGVKPGSYTHMSNSLHIYEKHYPMVERILNDPWVKTFPHKCSRMPAMPSLPPIDDLVSIEAKLRMSTSIDEINGALLEATSLDAYWGEWLIVLASHRAQKLDLPEFRDELLRRCVFTGYSLFEK
jgi:thymidylate synthase